LADQSKNSLLRDYGGTILFAVVIALLIRFFVIEAYRIPSAAMKPALEPGDTIFVEKWPFGLRLPWTDEPLTKPSTPHHGEIVIFSFEGEQTRDYIKRVVGLPGDTVEMQAGKLLLNGKPAEIKSARSSNCGKEQTPEGSSYSICWEGPGAETFAPKKVPGGSVFVAGDLRSGREKSAMDNGQNFGTSGIIPIASLKGRALWIWLSVDPQNRGSSTGLFPNFRFDRMFRRVQ
jgi:signal peptidase I